MALRDKLRRLEKNMRGQLGYFELADGTRYYFDPQGVFRHTFIYFANSLRTDYKREPRPEPPEILRAIANAKDRGEALALVMGDYSHLPIDQEALIQRGEFVPRSMVVRRDGSYVPPVGALVNDRKDVHGMMHNAPEQRNEVPPVKVEGDELIFYARNPSLSCATA